MEKLITIKSEYNSLEKLSEFLKKDSHYDTSIDYDIWEQRTDSNGLLEKCVILKKSSMHGMKLYLADEQQLKMSYIIPNKLMNAYFGKSEKARQNILEITTGLIKSMILSGPQKNAFEEMSLLLKSITK